MPPLKLHLAFHCSREGKDTADVVRETKEMTVLAFLKKKLFFILEHKKGGEGESEREKT